MRTPEQVLGQLQTRWARSWTQWLGGQGTWPQSFSLDPPTEAAAQRDWPAFAHWLGQWPLEGGFGRVEVVRKRWPMLGEQDIPLRVNFDSAADVALALGEQVAQRYALADARWRDRAAAWPDLAEPLRAVAGWFLSLSGQDYGRFIATIDWLSANPRSDLYVRQLPIPDTHSKWVEANAGPIRALMDVRLGSDLSLPFLQLVGLKAAPTLRRIRLLDPALRAEVAGLSDLTIPLDELAALTLDIRLALVIENQQTALACTDLPGTVVIMGGGTSVTELAAVPWLRRIPILYWGDLDSAGFAILHSLRTHLGHVQSVLMGEDTLLAHREFWTEDVKQSVRLLSALTPGEATVYRCLGSGELGVAVRLEQERLPWTWAWPRVCEAAKQARLALAPADFASAAQ